MTAKVARRPQPLDAEVIDNLAGRLFPNVKAWLETNGEIFTEQSEQGLFDELVDLLHQNQGRWDGYDLARELEERSWVPNAELVGILHEADTLAYHSLREEVVRWVTTNALVPAHVVGDHVTFRLYKNEPPMTGEIAAVHHASLEYSVRLGSGVTLVVPEESVDRGGDQ